MAGPPQQGFSLRPDLRAVAASRVAAVLQAGIDEGAFLGAQVYVSFHGAVLADLALGEARVGMPMTTESLVSWQCNTKPVTAAATCLLWDRGLLDLDDPVVRHLPDFARHGKADVTLRHLLTHTAGFADDPPLATLGSPSWEEVARLVYDSRLEQGHKPGGAALYSPWYGYATLGLVVSRVDGRPFPRFVREEVIEPLGMDGCWIGVEGDTAAVDVVADRMAFLYDTGGDDPHVPPIGGVFQARGLGSCSPASGGIGPMRELGLFYESLLDSLASRPGALLGAVTVRAMHEQPGPWGLGPLVISGHFGAWCPRAFGHDGLRSSLVFADPEHGVVVAAFVNSMGRGHSNIELLLEVSRAVYRSVLSPAELSEVGLVVDTP
jgi:CubicO group peptidase (beta-lactamase class C family)